MRLFASGVAQEIVENFYLCDCLGYHGCDPRILEDSDAKQRLENLIFDLLANAGGEFRRDSDVNSTALLADSGGDK